MNERERIELLMKCNGLTASQFADKTGIQRASVSHIISGRNKPSLDVMLKIYEAFPELDLEWLMTGSGEEPVVRTSKADNSEDSLFSQDSSYQKEAVRVKESIEVEEKTSVDHKADLLHDDEMQQVRTPRQPRAASERLQRKPSVAKIRQQSLQERRIKEIRIFYSDGTYETLFPEK